VRLVLAGTFYLALASSSLANADELRGEDGKPLPPEEAQRVERMRKEANDVLLHGEFDRARHDFEQILRLVPNDASAQRDAARAAQAAGQFEYAAEALERAHHFEQHIRDPEVHYLRGEALYTLDRPEEAKREHQLCELEIGPHPTERMQKLWLARIYARKGYLVLADGLYDSMWPAAPAIDTEVAANQADAHLMNKDWEGGAAVLHRWLEREPKSIRGREMLAWALEASGHLDEELAVRRSLAADEPTAPNDRDYGRALERAADFRAARDEYHQALEAGGADPDGTLVTSYRRMLYRTTPEVAGGLQLRSDPQAWSWHLQAGAAVPFRTHHQLSIGAWRDSATDWTANLPNFAGDATLKGTGTVTGLAATALLGVRSGASLVLSGDTRYSSTLVRDSNGIVYRDTQNLDFGGWSELDLPFLNHFEVNLHGDLNEQWSEAPITIHEGGKTTGATAHLFLFPTSRVVLIDSGVQVRRLTIDPQQPSEPRPAAEQALFWGGIDFNLWAAPTRIVRGEALDERMVRRTYLTDAGIFAYRHYELVTDMTNDFRIALAPRSSIDNGTLIIRKALRGGWLGFDVHGGFGYDNARRRVLSQGGGALVLAASWKSRLLLSYDMTHETATGVPGTLHIGWITYHADL
jgi:tetratricopeptide (TPR) repeat protein